MVFEQLSTSMEVLGKQNVIGPSLLRFPCFDLLLVGNKNRLWRNQRALVNTLVGIRSIIYGISSINLGFIERKHVDNQDNIVYNTIINYRKYSSILEDKCIAL